MAGFNWGLALLVLHFTFLRSLEQAAGCSQFGLSQNGGGSRLARASSLPRWVFSRVVPGLCRMPVREYHNHLLVFILVSFECYRGSDMTVSRSKLLLSSIHGSRPWASGCHLCVPLLCTSVAVCLHVILCSFHTRQAYSSFLQVLSVGEIVCFASSSLFWLLSFAVFHGRGVFSLCLVLADG